MSFPEGQCLKCKTPLFIETGKMRPFCSDCEKKINQTITNGMAAKGKEVKGKCLVFPETPEDEEDDVDDVDHSPSSCWSGRPLSIGVSRKYSTNILSVWMTSLLSTAFSTPVNRSTIDSAARRP